jgi:hypothetical protein
MMDTDYMNDRHGHYKEIVTQKDVHMLHHYFFNDMRSGHAKLNAVEECTRQLWEEGLEMLVRNHKASNFCYLDGYVLRKIEEASADIKILKQADALIANEARDAEKMHALIVDKKTSVLIQLFILDRCIEAGWAEPLTLLIERTSRTHASWTENLPPNVTYFSVYEKAVAGLKAIASGLRTLEEKGKVAEVIRQKPAQNSSVLPAQGQKRRV